MKNIYWRPSGISEKVLLLLALVSVSFMYVVETFKIREKQPYYREKIQAARLAQKAFSFVKKQKLERGIAIDKETDPSMSALIGVLMSSVTSNSGSLSSKQTSVNPNFAAVMVQLLKKAGARDGDIVACGISGSFPAINIALFAAMQTLNLKPVIISSVSGSQWGANNPEYLWIDMEKDLHDAGMFQFKSVTASYGGIEDRAMGLSRKGKTIIETKISQSGLPLLQAETFLENINERMRIYSTFSETSPVKVYVNIGGGSISVGRKVGKKMYAPGLNRSLPPGAYEYDSVMTRFIQDGIPVIHITQIEAMARKYGLPNKPDKMPPVGDGIIYIREEYNKWLAGFVLLLLLAMLYLFHNTDIGHKLLKSNTSKSSNGIEPMI